MRPGMTMLMLDKMRQGDQMPRNEYGSTQSRRMIGYDRDYQREHTRAPSNTYGGRHMPPMDEYDDTPQMGGYNAYNRMEARRGRDSRGRFAMAGMDDDDEEDYSPRGSIGSSAKTHRGDMHAKGAAYTYDSRRQMDDAEMSDPVDEQTARMWVRKMSAGEHFKPEQAEQFRGMLCPHCDKWEWFVAINAMYSDYCETGKKIGVDRPEFYAHLAKDFLMDDDAGPHKLRKYMTVIPK